MMFYFCVSPCLGSSVMAAYHKTQLFNGMLQW